MTTPSSSTVPQTIRLLYGQTIAKCLLRATVTSDRQVTRSREGTDAEAARDRDSQSWEAEAQFTNANYQAKKMVFLLFINRNSQSNTTEGVTCSLRLSQIG